MRVLYPRSLIIPGVESAQFCKDHIRAPYSCHADARSWQASADYTGDRHALQFTIRGIRDNQEDCKQAFMSFRHHADHDICVLAAAILLKYTVNMNAWCVDAVLA